MSFKKIAIISLFVLLLGSAISIISNIRDTFVDKSDEIEVEDNSYKNIHILTDNASVKIVPTKEEKTKIEFTGKVKKKSKYNFQAVVKGDTLQVELTQKNWGFIQIGFNSLDIQLIVNVPEKEYTLLKAEADNGRIHAENLQLKIVEMETANGSIELVKIAADEVLAETNNGQIIMDDVEGKLNAETDNGRIILKTNNLERSIRMKTDNGFIKIQTDKEPTNATIEANVDVGLINVFGNSNEQTIFGEGKNLIQLETDNGKITVNNSN